RLKKPSEVEHQFSPPPPPPKKDPQDKQKWLVKPLKQPCYKRINKWIRILKETGKIPPPNPSRNGIKLFPSIRQLDTPPSSETQKINFPPLEEKKKPNTYDLFLQIKAQKEAEKKEAEERKRQKEKALGKRPVEEENTEKSPSPPRQVSKSLMIQKEKLSNSNPLSKFLEDYNQEMLPKISILQKPKESSSSKSTSEDFESSDVNLDLQVMATTQPNVKVEMSDDKEMIEAAEPSNARHSPHVSGGKMIFTLDDIPTNKWPERLQEFHAWLETKRLTEKSHYNILMEFVSRFAGMLKDWWNPISQEYQMQFLVLTDLSQAIKIIHNHFIRSPEDLLTLKRRKFLKKRCCSYKRRDLSKHFYAITKLFCALGLDPSLKQGVLTSIPDPLQVVVYHNLQRQGKNIINLTIGEIQQETFIALEDLCNRRKVFKDYLHGDRMLDKACDDSYLKIKCGKEKSCYCPTRKKKHFRRFKKFAPKIPRKKKFRWRFLKKKRFSKEVKSTRCYICNQKGHFAKSCPNNKKGAKMIQ
ncbi:hypothetical protein Golax_000790, partial [Gossypium laxum]|nr:hypothetical protein [Gossypium laxum]